MNEETTYTPADLHSGTCDWCGMKSNELIYTENEEKVCVDCFESEKFYQETMKGV